MVHLLPSNKPSPYLVLSTTLYFIAQNSVDQCSDRALQGQFFCTWHQLGSDVSCGCIQLRALPAGMPQMVSHLQGLSWGLLVTHLSSLDLLAGQ